jgi:hypothetical protein
MRERRLRPTTTVAYVLALSILALALTLVLARRPKRLQVRPRGKPWLVEPTYLNTRAGTAVRRLKVLTCIHT